MYTPDVVQILRRHGVKFEQAKESFTVNSVFDYESNTTLKLPTAFLLNFKSIHININTSNTIWNILSISEFFKCHWTIFSHNHKKIGHILHNMEKIDCSIEFTMVLHHP